MAGSPMATWRDGAIVGGAIGAVTAISGMFASQWWLIAAVPAGAASGATAARWIRADGRIPIRAVFVPTLVATIVGAYAIVIVLEIGSALQAGDSLDVIPTIAWFGLIALGFAGIPAFLAILPFAWAAAILLRRHLRASAGPPER